MNVSARGGASTVDVVASPYPDTSLVGVASTIVAAGPRRSQCTPGAPWRDTAAARVSDTRVPSPGGAAVSAASCAVGAVLRAERATLTNDGVGGAHG